MRTTNIAILIILSSIAGCSKQEEPPPIQTLLDAFSEALANRNTESAIGLFLAPDDTPEGLNRKYNIDKLQNNSPESLASETLTVSFSNIESDNESHLEADIRVVSASGGTDTATLTFEVCLLNNEWKIVTMD